MSLCGLLQGGYWWWGRGGGERGGVGGAWRDTLGGEGKRVKTGLQRRGAERRRGCRLGGGRAGAGPCPAESKGQARVPGLGPRWRDPAP